jgi:hypothetical protein
LVRATTTRGIATFTAASLPATDMQADQAGQAHHALCERSRDDRAADGSKACVVHRTTSRWIRHGQQKRVFVLEIKTHASAKRSHLGCFCLGRGRW